jgi:hypothetical protein
MLFLMNDRVLDLDLGRFKAPLSAGRFESLSLAFVIKLGQELYADAPLLHLDEPDRAERLALLIAMKAPEVNAALFVAPSQACRPDQVTSRLASLSLEVMAGLYMRHRDGGLNVLTADREVWRRMAA